MDTKSTQLFICGCPRSATTRFTRWLLSSDAVVLGIERYQNYWDNHLQLPNYAFEESRFFNIQTGDSWYNSFDQLQEKNYYESMRKRWKQAKIIGDKIPYLWKNLPGLFKSYPDAKVIYLLREPFSVARSYKQRALNPEDMDWGKDRDASFAIHDWNQSVKKIIEIFNDNSSIQFERVDKKIFIIRFEDFVHNCLDTESLFNFLGCRLSLRSMVEKQILSTRIQLSEIEKEVIWTLLDFELVKEIRCITDKQRLYYLQTTYSDKEKRYKYTHPVDRSNTGIDYGEFQIPDCSFMFRGRSKPFNPEIPYAVCIGGSATFGRFIHEPYPSQLEKINGMTVLNLGIEDARPETYLVNESLFKIIKGAEFIILEFMSAHGYQSPIFKPVNFVGNHGYFMDFFNLKSYVEKDKRLKWLMDKAENNESVFVDEVYQTIFKYLSESQRDLIRNVLINRYCNDIRLIIEQVQRPVIALLMTQNQPFQLRRKRNPQSYEEWAGAYPRFVDEVVLQYLKQLGVLVVESRPRMSFSYPSQDMHDNAVSALIQIPFIKNINVEKCHS